MATATVERTGKRLIESDRVEGTTVYDPQGNNIGNIKRVMIDKTSGQVAYAVMSFGGFLGMGTEEHAIPWNKLTYDTSLRRFSDGHHPAAATWRARFFTRSRPRLD
jgi:sporulation protein YlmC with PRC-barrel domain